MSSWLWYCLEERYVPCGNLAGVEVASHNARVMFMCYLVRCWFVSRGSLVLLLHKSKSPTWSCLRHAWCCVLMRPFVCFFFALSHAINLSSWVVSRCQGYLLQTHPSSRMAGAIFVVEWGVAWWFHSIVSSWQNGCPVILADWSVFPTTLTSVWLLS